MLPAQGSVVRGAGLAAHEESGTEQPTIRHKKSFAGILLRNPCLRAGELLAFFGREDLCQQLGHCKSLPAKAPVYQRPPSVAMWEGSGPLGPVSSSWLPPLPSELLAQPASGVPRNRTEVSRERGGV